ncbi:MAG TPA: DUF2330 domain-containing protein [Gemmataceae bacterium]|nr:DUF2330 domain-containing protein [Gemmataceae bacterium]
MSRNIRPTLLFLLLAISLAASVRASACAVVTPHSQGNGVQIATESAIIIWDSASKTQHFIRRAEFKSDVKDFGFLVPTPTKPTLAEADDEAFTTLGKITEPVTVTQKLPSGGGGCGCSGAAPKAGGNVQDVAEVRVLEEKRVAGHDAAVLEADNAKSLNAWLKEHGYVSRPELEAWLEPYVKAGWKITAFKIAKKESGEKEVATTALRMSFQTEQPFFPYREPAEQRKEAQVVWPRLLRVYFLSDKRMDGVLKDQTRWPGQTVWADEIKPADREKVLELLKMPPQTAPSTWWLTEFEDRASPRPGTDDVVFSVADKQGKIARPPRIVYVQSSLPGCVMCCAIVMYLGVTFLIRRFK